MAIIVEQAAKGNAPSTGMQKTPAPTKPARPAAPDVISQARKGGDAYGQNSGTANPSRLNPGEVLKSPMALNIEASSNDQSGESLLGRIARLGVAKSGDAVDTMSPQTRSGSDTAFPSAFGHAKRGADSGSPGGVIPTKINSPGTMAQLIRKP